MRKLKKIIFNNWEQIEKTNDTFKNSNGIYKVFFYPCNCVKVQVFSLCSVAQLFSAGSWTPNSNKSEQKCPWNSNTEMCQY